MIAAAQCIVVRLGEFCVGTYRQRSIACGKHDVRDSMPVEVQPLGVAMSRLVPGPPSDPAAVVA